MILKKLEYTIKYRQGLTLVYGEIGSGKSLLARVLMDTLMDTPENRPVLITNPKFKSDYHMIKTICANFRIKPKRSYDEQMIAFQAFLFDMNEKGKIPILIIDEAQLLKKKSYLELIRQILNTENDTEKLLEIVLLGQLELRDTLVKNPAILDRVSTSSLLQSLGPDDLAGLLKFRFLTAGGKPEILTHGFLEVVYIESQGMPRRAIAFCGQILELAAMVGLQELTADFAKEAAKDVAR
jgi:general secretion pathway protein A